MANTEKPTSAAKTAADVSKTEKDLAAANNKIAVLENKLKDLDQALKVSEDKHSQKDAKIERLEGELDMALQANASVKDRLISEENKNNELSAALEAYQDKETVEQASKLLYKSEKGKTYEVTVPEFRFRGELYKSAKAIENHKEILEVLIKNKSFILKAV